MSSRKSSGGGGGTPVRLDEALRRWPAGERTALEWDDSAEAVLARLGDGPGEASRGVSDEALMAAPLPERPEEMQSSAPVATAAAGEPGKEMNSTSSRQRDRASLRELAKLADTTPPSSQPSSGRSSQPPSQPGARPSSPGSGRFDTSDAKAAGVEREENSGLIHLAALAAEAAPAPASAPPSSTPSVAAPAPAAAPVARPKAAATAKSSSSRGLYFVGTLVAAAAVAAGVFVGMKRPAADLSGPVAVTAPPAAAPVVPAAPAKPGAPVGTPLAAADRGVDPFSLPSVDTTSPGHAAPSAPRAAGAGAIAATATTAPAVASPTAAPAPAPPPVAVIPTSTAAPDDGKSLQSLMQQAAGVTPSTTQAAPASPDAPQAVPGSVPLKPSLGAIQGALGAALPAARACLGPDDPVSRAMVTFQSDGSVQSVSVSGGAAGKPAEACIRGALMKARVAPFAQPTFSAPATIRGS